MMIKKMMDFLGLTLYKYSYISTYDGEMWLRDGNKVKISEELLKQVKEDLINKCRKQLEIDLFNERVGCNPFKEN